MCILVPRIFTVGVEEVNGYASPRQKSQIDQEIFSQSKTAFDAARFASPSVT
jgi:hypothetical protein